MSINFDLFIDEKDIKTGIVLVTPKIANEWLKFNINNRRLKPSVVSGYVDDMKSGRWTLGNDSITFDSNGILTNGQHRLKAIELSGTSQFMPVMYGVEHNINMDRPALRKQEDNLCIFSDLPEILTKRVCVSMCNFIRKSINDASYASKNLYGVYDFINENKNSLKNFFEEVPITKSGANKTKFYNAYVLAAFYIAYINGVPMDIINNMRHVLNTREYVFDGYSIDRFMPAVKLDMALCNVGSKHERDRYESFLRTMYAIECIDDNKNLKKLNKPVEKICYDFTYKGRKLSECHDARVKKEKEYYERVGK